MVWNQASNRDRRDHVQNMRTSWAAALLICQSNHVNITILLFQPHWLFYWLCNSNIVKLALWWLCGNVVHSEVPRKVVLNGSRELWWNCIETRTSRVYPLSVGELRNVKVDNKQTDRRHLVTRFQVEDHNLVCQKRTCVGCQKWREALQCSQSVSLQLR